MAFIDESEIAFENVIHPTVDSLTHRLMKPGQMVFKNEGVIKHLFVSDEGQEVYFTIETVNKKLQINIKERIKLELISLHATASIDGKRINLENEFESFKPAELEASIINRWITSKWNEVLTRLS